MKRVIVVIDDLRRDTAKELLFPHFKAKFHEVQSLGTYTREVFSQFAKAINAFPGWRGIVSDGFGSKMFQNLDVDFYHEAFYPVKEYEKLLPLLKPPKENTLLVLHDYWVHNYWSELNLHPTTTNALKSYKDMLVFYYKKRAIQMIKPLIELRKHFLDWEFYITSDHGEAFWEDGKTRFHGRNFPRIPSLVDNFVIDFQFKEKLTQVGLMRGE